MDVLNEVKKIGKKLQKLTSEDANHKQAEEMLRVLKDYPIDLDILSKSKIGVIVNEFRKNCSDEKTKTMAKSLIKTWKKTYDESKQQKSSVPVSKEEDSQDSGSHRSESPHAGTSSKASPGSGSLSQNAPSSRTLQRSASGNPFNLRPSSTSDSVRLKCRQLLAESLQCPEHEGLDFDVLAAAIEDHIYEEFNDTDAKYKNRVKSRVMNIRDAENPQLKKNILEGSITPDRIAKMTPKEMASDELKKEIEKYIKESIDDHRLAVNLGSRSDFYKCSRCGKRDTTYNQAQTRSADEPMTTFVLCNNCGKRWKHN